MSVRIYIEGGGDQDRTIQALRAGFVEFFKKVVPKGRRPRIIPGGGRTQTFDRFKAALAAYPDDIVLLVVDSEDPVARSTEGSDQAGRRREGAGASGTSEGGTIGPWDHLKERDRWERPAGATDEQAHLMVQCMEAWFLADKETLADYYGQGFRPNALPQRADVETIPKREVLRALRAASRNTRTKGAYDKLRHGSDLLARIRPPVVCGASPWAERLCAVLKRASSP